jgi:hypothetical protein
MVNNFESEKIFDEIIVYKNYLPNADKITDILKRSEFSPRTESSLFQEWTGWYTFGDQVSFPWMPNIEIDEILEKEFDVYNKDIDPEENEEEYVCKSLSSVFYNITKKYLEETGYELPSWEKMGLTLCRYRRGESRYAMAYHTDYVKSKVESPGYKFGITCTIYLNDDYEGGEVTFLQKTTGQVIQYKPNAGDIVFFPSGEPYYHGVNQITSGEKYFIRLFWGWDYEGSKEWHENAEKYGLEEWEKIETAEIKKHFHEGTYHIEVVWDENELNDDRFVKGPDNPTVTPFFSSLPLIKKGKGYD